MSVGDMSSCSRAGAASTVSPYTVSLAPEIYSLYEAYDCHAVVGYHSNSYFVSRPLGGLTFQELETLQAASGPLERSNKVAPKAYAMLLCFKYFINLFGQTSNGN